MPLRHYILIAAAAALLLAVAAILALPRRERWNPAYLRALDRIDIYDNAVGDALPQTAAHDIIMEHFAKAREDGRTPKCLIVGYDGARAEALAEILPNESGIQALADGGGKVYHMYTGGEPAARQLTDTAPGWAALLTGQWSKGEGGNGVVSNGVNKPAQAPPVLMTALLEQGLARKSVFAVSWNGHFADDGATYKYDIQYAAQKGLDARWITVENDRQTQESMLQAVREGADIVMGILEYCDHAGHGGGFGNRNPQYAEAFQRADRAALELIRAVKARPAAEDWLVVLTSDHGGIGRGHGSRHAVCRQVFFAVNQTVKF